MSTASASEFGLQLARETRERFVQATDAVDARKVSLPPGNVVSHLWSPNGVEYACVMQLPDGLFLQVLPAPLGGAAGTAAQVRSLQRRGVDPKRATAGILTFSLLQVATVGFLAVIGPLMVVLGIAVPSTLAKTALLGCGALMLITKMFCDGLMDKENQILGNLQKVNRFEIRYGLLYLYNSNDLLLTYKK